VPGQKRVGTPCTSAYCARVKQAGTSGLDALPRSRAGKPGATFTQPVRQLLLMLIVLALVATGTYLIYPQLAPVFLISPWINGTIAAIFLLGVIACFLQVFQVSTSVGWIEDFAADRPAEEMSRAPLLLAPLSALLANRGARTAINASSARTILDSVATRLDEARDITRYIINLLVFLGLLGTFYGLATTVPAVVDTIRSLNPQEGEDGMQVFGRLMSGLESQLGGMGTAFATSLLGLAGSLVVGLLELFAGHGQNRFYRELEEWLSTITRIGFSSGDGEGSAMDQNVARVLDQMIEQIETLQTLFVRSDAARGATEDEIRRLTRSIEAMTARMDEEADDGATATALARIAEGQERMIAALETRAAPGGEGEMDPEARMRLRSIDTQLLRILEEMAAGRQESIAELRTDLAALARALRLSAREPGGVASPPRPRG